MLRAKALASGLLALVVAVGGLPVLPAAAALGPVGAPGAVAVARSNADVIAGIQETLDARSRAIANRDQAAFEATIDPGKDALALKGVQVQQFKDGALRGYVDLRVDHVKEMPAGLYKAWVRLGDRAEAVWVFRNVDGKWLVSEPTEAELGKRIVADSPHFRFRYYEWDQDIIEQMVTTLERAYDRVASVLNYENPDKTFVYLTPSYRINPALRNPYTLASASVEGKSINMHSIESYGAGFYDIDAGPLEEMYPTITHEYTHVVNNAIVSLARIPKWMSEGLAEHVSLSYRRGEVARALARGRDLTPDWAHETIFYGTEKGYSPADISLAYGVSALATKYLIETYGIDAFWNLAKGYDKSRDWEGSVQSALGISWSEFTTRFKEWLPSAVR